VHQRGQPDDRHSGRLDPGRLPTPGTIEDPRAGRDFRGRGRWRMDRETPPSRLQGRHRARVRHSCRGVRLELPAAHHAPVYRGRNPRRARADGGAAAAPRRREQPPSLAARSEGLTRMKEIDTMSTVTTKDGTRIYYKDW